jgi:Fe-S cluster biogenesis protein NfuA
MMAAALLVAALIFAPVGAYAHGGHSHDVQPVKQAAKPVLAHPAETKLTETAPLAAEDGGALSSRSVEALSGVLPASSSKACGSCPGGCCHSGGTGCCAAFIAAAFEIGIPSLERSRLSFVVVRGAGITPDALPEPPKSLV